MFLFFPSRSLEEGGQVQEKVRFSCLHGKSLATLALTLASAFTAQETCLQPVPEQQGGLQHKAATSLVLVPFPRPENHSATASSVKLPALKSPAPYT